MQTLERFLKVLGTIAIILLVVAFQFFVGLAILSMSIVPLTYLYCLITGRSYNSTIDSSNMLYKINTFGQWSYVVVASCVIFYFVFKTLI